MKALTIKQPWASLIVLGEKKIETRSWKTSYRGPILIHAGKNIEKGMFEFYFIQDVFKKHQIKGDNELPVGSIIAKANLVGCLKMVKTTINDVCFTEKVELENGEIVTCPELYFGDYEVGRYAWILEDIEPIEPISAKGQLSLWNFDL